MDCCTITVASAGVFQVRFVHVNESIMVFVDVLLYFFIPETWCICIVVFVSGNFVLLNCCIPHYLMRSIQRFILYNSGLSMNLLFDIDTSCSCLHHSVEIGHEMNKHL